LNAGFTPAALRAAAPLIQRTVDQLLDGILASGPDNPVPTQPVCFDFMRDFARPLPALVMAGLLDIDAADREDFVAWSDDIAQFIGSPTPTLPIARRAQLGLRAMTEYFQQRLPRRRQAPGEDLVSLLIRAQAEGHIRTPAELMAQCCTLLFAGHETTRNLLGNGLLALLQHPRQWQTLMDSPSLLPAALKELLRFDSPVQYTGRRLKADIELHGRRMRRGELVIPLIGAANRDPVKFPDPDRLDIHRSAGAHLAFGHGPHLCIGAALTYLEAEIALRTLMQRLPRLQLTTDTPSWGCNAAYRGLKELPLRSLLN
jgi:cytochrome P450